MLEKKRVSVFALCIAIVSFGVGAHAQTASDYEKREGEEFLRYLIESKPQESKEVFDDFLDAIEVALTQSHKIAREQKIGLIDTAVRKLAIRRNIELDEARTLGVESLWRIRMILNRDSSAKRILFHKTRRDFLWIVQELSAATLDRLPSAKAYSLLLKEWADSLNGSEATHRQFFKLRKDEIRNLMNQSTSERVFKVWVNRENVETAAIATLLAAQGVCIVLSAGVCAATLPATQGLTVKAAVGGLQSAMAVTYGSVNLIDRYRAEGLRGLTSLGAIVDGLILVSGLPSPGKALIMSGYRGLSPKFFRAIATTQYQAGIAAGGILAGYGSWQLLSAESIAQNMNRDGIEATPAEIRRQGAMNLFFGSVSLVKSAGKAQEWKNGNEVEKQLLESSSVSQALKRMMRRSLSTVAPVKEVRQIITKVSGGAGAAQISVGQTLKNLGQVAYTTLFYHAAAVLSIAYPDFSHAREVKMPALDDGEIALTLNGFDRSDMLYHAFESRHARRHELDNYAEGKNYFYDTFSSATDLMEKIALYGRRGKIKYLRIMAHGIPGRIATRALDIEGAQGAFFDKDFMLQNEDSIREIARLSLAKNASIQITSCLVGANLDEKIKVREFEIEKRAGDEFMETLGKTLMVNGGTVYSSRRMLLGFDALYGSVGANFVRSGPLRPANALLLDREDDEIRQARNLIDIEAAQILAEQKRIEEKSKMAKSPEEQIDVMRMIRANSLRLVKTYAKVWTIVDKYGIKIEGPLFGSDRSRIDHFDFVR